MEEKLTVNKRKLALFLEIAEELEEKFSLSSILYGSLGLSLRIGELGKICEDIDILITDEYLNEKWNELKDLMQTKGFNLYNEKEHEFKRENDIIAFGKESNLTTLTKINKHELEVVEIGHIKFLLPTAEQYLKIYRLSKKDKYRKPKLKSDAEKTSLIKKYLKGEENA